MDIENIVRKYALQNSLEYNGEGKSGSVLGRIMSERKDLRKLAKILKNYVEEEVERANSLAKENGTEYIRELLTKENPDALIRKKQVRREGLPELKNAEKGKVVLRFAPNPNGPLTIGHSRGVVINAKFAEEYEGKVILRFDDTDTKVKPPLLEAYKWIEEDYEWITGKKPDVVIRASDRMPIYLKYAEKMISEGFGFVCKCSSEEFKRLRESGQGSPYRERSIQENLNDWNRMISGEMDEGGAVVRVKTSLDIPNPALRDWPALRIQHNEHPCVGDKYKVWPLLDFQSAIEDGYNGNWEISAVPHTTSEPVMNLYGGGLIMGNTNNADKMVAAYQWMKYITNTENSAVWSTESGYGFVRTSSADHPLIVAKRNDLPQYDRSLGLIKYGKGEPSVPAYYSVRGEIEKAYAAIINGDDIMSTLNNLNDEANAILADAIEN